MTLDIKRIPLAANQYFTNRQKKTHIFLHHTAGGSAASAVNSWASNKERVATAFIIERDGTIYNTFDPGCWAYHLGLRGFKSLEQASIGIELVSFGNLKPTEQGTLHTWTGRQISASEETVTPYRTFRYWQKYTDRQLSAVKQLVPHLCKLYGIPCRVDLGRIFEYNNPASLPAGIWSHSSVRADKVDCFPQPELLTTLANF